MTTARPSSPPVVSELSREQRLAALFAQEPELISACLQNIEQEPPETVARVLGAAQAALAVCPHHADLFHHAAQAAICAGRYETAAALLAGALRINPSYRDALVLAARVALRRGRTDEAKGYIRAALHAGAEYADVYLLYGNVWRSESEWGAARAAYQRALQLNADLTAAREALSALPAANACGKSHELPA